MIFFPKSFHLHHRMFWISQETEPNTMISQSRRCCKFRKNSLLINVTHSTLIKPTNNNHIVKSQDKKTKYKCNRTNANIRRIWQLHLIFLCACTNLIVPPRTFFSSGVKESKSFTSNWRRRLTIKILSTPNCPHQGQQCHLVDKSNETWDPRRIWHVWWLL